MATIRDVAAAAGVSVSTASRVIAGNPATSPASRAQVTAAVKALDFRPNTQAQSLRSTRTNSLGLLVSDVRNPFFADLAHAAEQAGLDAGYVTLLGNANERVDQQDRYLNTLIQRRVDGILLTPHGDGSGAIADIVRRGIPTVFVDRTVDGVDVPTVTTDSNKGIQQAVQHLSSMGHTRIGFISGPQSTSTGRERWAAYTNALAMSSLAADVELVYFGDYQTASGAAGMQKLMNLQTPPTAVIAADSLMAMGAISCVHEMKLKIGRDVALIAFDDIEMFTLLDPSLTVVSNNVHEMGKLAVGLLIDVIGGRNPQSIVLPSELIIRSSTSSAEQAGSIITRGH
ncbi:LacI family DNA-binding transcriptional regulator [Arthrobacter cryoconiti]|uniref:LacI family DNA-binding transcriptional regulator n=1 Tax=Arthrobacter cryoconiti TaxID=748907 RepID=A0ABV8R0V3_9MICC|nr:LacI family DNA-binding transcriptional regulator [Arthrobacter cryoconiti]MCC9069256.1 LacI family transcriptional regulator [Arthrobacter cryoconiti]